MRSWTFMGMEDLVFFNLHIINHNAGVSVLPVGLLKERFLNTLS